jgi:CRP-like cAMP-binding protein
MTNDAILNEIDVFFSKYPLRLFPKGHILVHANDNPIGVFHIVSGKVRQYDINDRGDEIVVNIFKTPAFFPMSWAINGGENRYFFEAMTDIEIRQAPAKDTVIFLKSHPNVMYDLLARLYSGIDGIQQRMTHLMGGSAYSRVIFELLLEYRRFGTPQSNSAYRLSINETQLAQNAGLTRETTNRELAKLKKLKLVTYSENTLIINDTKALQSALESEL